ncbi:hypothetical protein A5N83_06985 [Rhodococcus sp. 1139]|nr:hypothetical protein A5N83_06985 [Rhodococcus sp. 1139]
MATGNVLLTKILGGSNGEVAKGEWCVLIKGSVTCMYETLDARCAEIGVRVFKIMLMLILV